MAAARAPSALPISATRTPVRRPSSGRAAPGSATPAKATRPTARLRIATRRCGRTLHPAGPAPASSGAGLDVPVSPFFGSAARLGHGPAGRYCGRGLRDAEERLAAVIRRRTGKLRQPLGATAYVQPRRDCLRTGTSRPRNAACSRCRRAWFRSFLICGQLSHSSDRALTAAFQAAGAAIAAPYLASPGPGDAPDHRAVLWGVVGSATSDRAWP